jgi:hypothetical protein
VTSSGVYFHLRKNVCRWNDNQLRCRETGSTLMRIYRSADQAYVHQQGMGLMQVVDSSLKPVPGGARFAGEEITVLLAYRVAGEDRLLVGTRRLALWERTRSSRARFCPTARWRWEHGAGACSSWTGRA